jgi:Flp pilus assembly protein TadG
MDLTNMVLTRAELQDAADSAALAASSALSNDKKTVAQAKEIAENFFKTQMTSSQIDGASATVDIKETVIVGNAKSFKVSVSTSSTLQLNPLTRLLGQTTAAVSAASTAESATGAKSAVSMYFVLDRSGSMGEEITHEETYACPSRRNPNKMCTGMVGTGLTRIASLKLASASLLTQLDTADPTATFVRTGGVSYNNKAQSPTNLAWGTTGVRNYVNALTADGNTNSAPALQIAYDGLTKSTDGVTEEQAHANKPGNGQTPKKYIVFMTDGDNNQAGADDKTKTLCDSARSQTPQIEVYTVAFMAPSGGQKLLRYCATDSEHYFEAESTEDLLAAFDAIGRNAAAAMSRLTQ